MAQRKIIVTHTQSLVVHKILKADKGDTPLQQFIDTITNEAHVEPWIAERFAESWRWNHRNSNTTDQEPNKEAHAEKDYYIKSELPTKVTTTKNPANGTGIVAQIIALAEQGKSTQEIIAMGFNKSTVYRQVSEWRKRKKTAKGKVS